MRDKTDRDGAHQLLVYADGDNILGGRINTIKKNREIVSCLLATNNFSVKG